MKSLATLVVTSLSSNTVCCFQL